MKDSAGIIRQIIIAKKNTRIFFGSYYKNGQLQADLPLDEFGQYHGTGIFYYENGSVQSSGSFNHGLKSGEWKVYDQKGKIMATDSFDKNGQLIPKQLP
jgi:antitoxin component YwqK of YwqJK toxin-antitoxin module